MARKKIVKGILPHVLNMKHMSESARRSFPTTRWSVISRLRSAEPSEAEGAVREVFTSYRYPLYGYLRMSGMQHEDAEDVLQGFFEKLLRNEGLAQADQERGRLRTFLLTALSRFKINWQRGERRRHQRVQAESDLWDEQEARWQREQHATGETPEVFYDRQWACELIDHVRAEVRGLYVKRGRESLHDALAPHLAGGDGNEAMEEVAASLGLTANNLRVSLHRLRGDFRARLIQAVKQTVDDGEDVRPELQHLLGLFES